MRDGAPRLTENFLIARRLVEAGARVVSLNFSRWDWHGSNFQIARQEMPLLDRAVSALVEDLTGAACCRTCPWSSGASSAARRRSTTTPAGITGRRSPALLAGGGMRTGQVVGATDRLGEFPGATGHLSRSLRHALPQPRARCPLGPRVRPARPPTVSCRFGRRTDPGAGLACVGKRPGGQTMRHGPSASPKPPARGKCGHAAVRPLSPVVEDENDSRRSTAAPASMRFRIARAIPRAVRSRVGSLS